MVQKYFDKAKKEAGTAVLFAGNSLQDILFKIHFLKKIVSIREATRSYTMEELILLTDNFPYALPESRIKELIESIPILDNHDGVYSIKFEIDLAEWFVLQGGRIPKGMNLKLTWDEVENILGKKEKDVASWSTFDVKTAIQRGLEWCLHSVRVSEEFKIGGLPAFWECVDNDLRPVGIKQAGTCNSDTLGALSESLFGPVEINPAEEKDAPQLLNVLLQYNLNCLVTPDQNPYSGIPAEWNPGGFQPLEDQPGSFHPTVDATANFVTAASISYFFFDELQKRGVHFSIRKDELGKAILSSVDFLLRTKLDDGGWGIYRYPQGGFDVAPTAFSTSLTVISLGLAKMCGVIDHLERYELYGQINTALERTLDFILSRQTKYNGRSVWTMAFDTDTERFPQAEILGATLYCFRALFSMSRGMASLRNRIYPILREFVEYLEEIWKPDYDALFVYEFRIPLETRLNDTFNAWEIRLDVRLAALLLDFHNETFANPELGISLSPKMRRNIEITISRLLQEQHPVLGHWIDPINKRPFAVATLFALELLQAYLLAVKNMIG